MAAPACRFCRAPLHHTFVDLGTTPLCESHVSAQTYRHAEPFYPLRAYVCASCHLVQTEALIRPEEVFSQYAYFSSYADTWVQHAKRYVEMAAERFGLNAASFVTEVGSNDGYLLQHFVAKGIPALGIDPAANVVEAARQRNASSSPASATPARFTTNAAGAARTLTAPSRTSCVTLGWTTRFGIFLRTVTTSASIARPDSICRWAV